MVQPNDYRVRGVDVGNYFDAFRQGRTDRLAAEGEARNNALSKYLPGALEGDATARQSAMAATAGDPNMMLQLSQALAGADQQKLAKARETNGRMAALLNAVQGGQISLDQAKQIAVSELGVDPGRVANITEADIPGFIAQTQTVAEQLDRADKERAYQLDASRTRAQTARDYAAADASRANADFIRSGKGAGTFRPLPQRLQSSENEWLEKAQIASNNNADVATYIGKIDAGEFDPGVLKNRYEQAKSFFGVVDPNDVNARNYNVFLSTMERLRNESLRLNKGVQTEGDAQRAWNELFQNINDKTVVRDQLARIAALNERAARQMLALARNQRKSFFGRAYEEPDWSELGVNPSFLEAPREPVTSFSGSGVFSDAPGVQSPTAPVVPQGWSIKRVK